MHDARRIAMRVSLLTLVRTCFHHLPSENTDYKYVITARLHCLTRKVITIDVTAKLTKV